MIDVSTLQGWIEKLGYETRMEGPTTMRIRPRVSEVEPRSSARADAQARELPPFFVQVSDNWVLLSMLPMLAPRSYRPEDLGRRLLAANREMRLAKFALDKNGAVVLCAELPTESLDASEIADAVRRMVDYARRFAAEFSRRG